MPIRRPAAAIEPVSPMASSSAALPGPMAIDDPSRMRIRGSNLSFIRCAPAVQATERYQNDGGYRQRHRADPERVITSDSQGGTTEYRSERHPETHGRTVEGKYGRPSSGRLADQKDHRTHHCQTVQQPS